MNKKVQKKKGRTIISRNPTKQAYFIGKNGKAKEVRSAIDGVREAKQN